jgi:hypothetical protein
MTQETLKQLLEKYWNCETSIEEEQYLKTYFSGNDIPEELQKYRALFVWEKRKGQETGSKKLKTGFEKRTVIHFYPVIRFAASVLLVLSAGIGIYTHYQQEKFMDQIFSETYSDPEDALRETENVIEKVSAVLNLAKDIEEAKLDSLKTNSTNDIINE